MTEYIEKNTALAKLTALEITEPLATMTDAKRILADMPAADVVPVVHAKWEFAEQEFVEWCPTVISKFTCSNCGELVDDIHGKPRYCPWCGAKMQEQEEEA